MTRAELTRRERVCAELASAIRLFPTVLPRDTDFGDAATRVRKGSEDAPPVAAIIVWTCRTIAESTAEIELCCELMASGFPVYEACSGQLRPVDARQLHVVDLTFATSAPETERHAIATLAARRAVALEGRWLGGRRPLGWVFDDDGEAGLDAVPARHIRTATARILAGASVGMVVAEWNAAGFTTLTGRQWTFGSTRRVLLRARNAGLTEYQGRIVGKSAWPAIVSSDDWTALRARLLGREPNEDPGLSAARSQRA